MDETLNRSFGSLAAPLIFMVIVALQLIPILLDRLNKRELWNADQIKLRQEIKELMKEASSFSNPSTFAQATKLKRAAAAKEKELVKSQELHNKEKKVAHETYAKALMILKVVAYLILIFWFWGDSVAAVSHQLMQPFGKLVSWRAGVSTNGLVTVGIVPWLILSNRVSKFICQRFTK